MFKEAATYNNHTDLQYTETVTSYIKKCIDDVTVTKTITTRANQKPWMTAEVCGLLKTRDEAFRSGDKAALKTARANLSCGIKMQNGGGGITWPFNGDAGLVFRSVHFATYRIILSVKFKPLCIEPIMSASADKGDRKREIEQSPMKKKFRDSTISRENLDEAIANGVKLALKEQQSTLNSVVNSAVRDAMDSMLIPALRELREDMQATNKSVKELREEFEAIVITTKQTRDRIDSVQADTREDRRTVTDLRNKLERLTEKMTDIEDRGRRNNVRLVGLPEGMEGTDAASFLRVNLSK